MVLDVVLIVWWTSINMSTSHWLIHCLYYFWIIYISHYLSSGSIQTFVSFLSQLHLYYSLKKVFTTLVFFEFIYDGEKQERNIRRECWIVFFKVYLFFTIIVWYITIRQWIQILTNLKTFSFCKFRFNNHF